MRTPAGHESPHPCHAGTAIDPEYVQDEYSPYCTGEFYGQLCKACAPCNTSIAADRMSRKEQASYKYQVRESSHPVVHWQPCACSTDISGGVWADC